MSFAAMSCELEFKTLHGGVITLETMMETTLGELKTMLLDRHPRAEDPIERKAQTSQSRAASRLFNHGDGGCSDTGRNRAARG